MRGLLGVGLIVGGVYLAYVLLSGRTILGIGSGAGLSVGDSSSGTSDPGAGASGGDNTPADTSAAKAAAVKRMTVTTSAPIRGATPAL